MNKTIKPFMRWAGSKRQLSGHLKQYWSDDHSRYLEPFMGSANLFFNVQPSVSILSDSNFELVNCFDVIKNHPKRLSRELSVLRKDRDLYYEIRAINKQALGKIRRAAYFLYLNRFCFNGLYRTNLQGKFNVPYAPNKTGGLPSLELLYEVSGVLANSKVVCEDYSSFLLSNVIAGDFIYLDPPYVDPNKRIFNEYGPSIFNWGDFLNLVSLLKNIDDRGATFLLSFAFSQEALDLLSDWGVAEVLTRRTINSDSGKRGLKKELVATNRNIITSRECDVILNG